MLQHKTRRWGYVLPIFFSSLFLLILLYFSASSFADQNKVSFDAEAILPENQISEASYFDLKVQAASASVVAAIEKAGGSFEKVATPLRQSAKEAEEK